MMQEVSSDDTNGESTFEFVEGSVNPSDTLSTSSHSNITGDINPVSTGGATSTSNVSAAGSIPTSDPMREPFPQSIQSPLPPPAALPSFLVPPMSDSVTTATPQPPSPYIYSQISANTVPQPYSPLSMPTATQPTIFIPSTPSQSTALDLPITDYGVGYQPSSPQQFLDAGNNAGMWGWIKGTVSGNDFLTKMAEKAKNSVDSMITTLDPQMKDYIYSGGDIDLIVSSENEDKISAVREAFQTTFGRATVSGLAAQSNIAVQPVGYSAGLKGAEDRISYLRMSGRINERQPIVAIENFIAELTPERWYDIGCIVLDDPAIESPIHVYTQATPIPVQYVNQMQRDTPVDYPLRWSGLSIPVGKVIGQALQVPHNEWHKYVTGIPRRHLILMAAKTLAMIYKSRRDVVASFGELSL